MKNKQDYISIGKIINFFGIRGEAKIGFDNKNNLEKAKKVVLLDDKNETELDITSIRYHKNFAIVKFKQINDINDLMQYKGQRLFTLKENILKNLSQNEYLINDLIGLEVFYENGEKLGQVTAVSASSSQDLLNIKNMIGQTFLVPFVDEFFPDVDIENKKIIIKPIEGLLS